jgi:hypothetical protein
MTRYVFSLCIHKPYELNRAVFSRQVMCFYFVFTVFSTVGFGDVFAVNTTERVNESAYCSLIEVFYINSAPFTSR